MNRIDKLFKDKNKNILSIYFTAGHPTLNATAEIILALQESGVDMIEIGMPFSDPMADGPVIQQSSQKALNNGMTLKLLFEQLKDIRKKVHIPLLLMGYLNPVYRFGFEEFCKKCNEVGIDGLILPDMPMNEYEEINKPIMDKYGLYNIFLVTPQTSNERIQKIDSLAKGFIYMVSSYSTTGNSKGLDNSFEYFKKIQSIKLNNPTIVGFGISNKTTFDTACQYANGAIIGSAFVRKLESEGVMKNNIATFIAGIIK